MSLAAVHKRPFWEIFIVWDCWVFEKFRFFQILILKIWVSCFTEMCVSSSPPRDSNFLHFLFQFYFVSTIMNDFNIQYVNIRNFIAIWIAAYNTNLALFDVRKRYKCLALLRLKLTTLGLLVWRLDKRAILLNLGN